MRHVRRWMKARLHRVIFMWFGWTILLTGVVFSAVLFVGMPGGADWRDQVRLIQRYVSNRFVEVWDDPVAREHLARDAAHDLEMTITLRDEGGAQIARFGEVCRGRTWETPVVRHHETIGFVDACWARSHGVAPLVVICALLAGVFVLWGGSGHIARRLTRPLGRVVQVAEDIGAGKLDSRVHLRREQGEIRVLGEAINDMASRIEKQLRDQRELLAAVSHEIRTPLGHMRVLVDIARDQGATDKVLAEIEQEVLEVDRLVDQLLASSRLEFDQLDVRRLDAAEIVVRALDRIGLDVGLLHADDDVELALEGDPTLLARALGNLLENAIEHGGGVTAVRVTGDRHDVRFEVDDHGPGFDPADRDRVFDAFYRGDKRAGSSHGSLGLGLSLVRRIARAHGGSTWVSDANAKGARVGFSVARRAG